MTTSSTSCQRCSTVNPEGFRYCGGCGAALGEPTPAAPPPGPACATCGAALPPMASWCPRCGATVGSGPPTGPPPLPTDRPPGAGVEVTDDTSSTSTVAGLVTALVAVGIVVALALVGILAGRAAGG